MTDGHGVRPYALPAATGAPTGFHVVSDVSARYAGISVRNKSATNTVVVQVWQAKTTAGTLSKGTQLIATHRLLKKSTTSVGTFVNTWLGPQGVTTYGGFWIVLTGTTPTVEGVLYAA